MYTHTHTHTHTGVPWSYKTGKHWVKQSLSDFLPWDFWGSLTYYYDFLSGSIVATSPRYTHLQLLHRTKHLSNSSVPWNTLWEIALEYHVSHILYLLLVSLFSNLSRIASSVLYFFSKFTILYFHRWGNPFTIYQKHFLFLHLTIIKFWLFYNHLKQWSLDLKKK